MENLEQYSYSCFKIDSLFSTQTENRKTRKRILVQRINLRYIDLLVFLNKIYLWDIKVSILEKLKHQLGFDGETQTIIAIWKFHFIIRIHDMFHCTFASSDRVDITPQSMCYMVK